MKKRIHFLAGLPRSGSTLLGSILNKHNQIHVTPTSPNLDFICKTEVTISSLTGQYTFDKDAVLHNVTQAIFDSIYNHLQKPIIFDKHRGWPRNLGVAQSFVENELIGIMTHRPIPEVIVSYLKLINKDPGNFIDAHLRRDLKPINTRNRADYLWRFYISDPYESCLIGLERYKDKILPVSYDEITTNTEATLLKIEQFFEIQGVADLNLSTISNTCAEDKDEAWGLKDLHNIRPTIAKTSDNAMAVLGEELFNYYSKFDLTV